MDTFEIFNIIEEIPRRGGLQTEGYHVCRVREHLLSLFDKHGIYSHNLILAGDLAVVHDIREIGLSSDTIKYIESLCTPNILIGLDILSRKVGESSLAHFKRVLSCGDATVLAVKWADCMANAEYTEAEKDWHNKTFEYDYSIDQQKYLNRADKVLAVLKSM